MHTRRTPPDSVGLPGAVRVSDLESDRVTRDLRVGSGSRPTVVVLGSISEQIVEVLRGIFDVTEMASKAALLTTIRSDKPRVVVVESGAAISREELVSVLTEAWAGSVHTVFVEVVTPGDVPLPVELTDGRVIRLSRPIHPTDAIAAVQLAMQVNALRTKADGVSDEAVGRTACPARSPGRTLPQVGSGGAEFHAVCGRSEKLRAVITELGRVRDSDITVHIFGETGCGKELIARALHEGSRRRSGPFVAHNCAAMSEPLMLSTLFGHRRGAFTGADRDRPGVFQAAHGGTLFLDEVGELSPAVQAALLRTLQSGEVVRVGANQPERVDVRIVSATSRSLKEETQAGRFRADLYFRLVVFSVELPPLRDRFGDIPLLAQCFLELAATRCGKQIPGLSPEALEALERYAWPGNVRELENTIERAVLLTDSGERIPLLALPPIVRAMPSAEAPGDGRVLAGQNFDDAVLTYERALVANALAESGGVLTYAAKRLGIERSRLSRMVRRLGLVSRSTTPDP